MRRTAAPCLASALRLSFAGCKSDTPGSSQMQTHNYLAICISRGRSVANSSSNTRKDHFAPVLNAPQSQDPSCPLVHSDRVLDDRCVLLQRWHGCRGPTGGESSHLLRKCPRRARKCPERHVVTGPTRPRIPRVVHSGRTTAPGGEARRAAVAGVVTRRRVRWPGVPTPAQPTGAGAQPDVSTAGEQFYVFVEGGNGWLAAVRSEAVSEVGECFR
jgi:hypothetical protein